jgi:general stress protein 26
LSEKIKSEIVKLRKKSKFAYVGSINEEGFPQNKCMFIIKDDDVHVHYFSTNTSSRRVQQFRKNPKASVYYCNEMFFKGALFTGTIEIVDDIEIKKRFWNKGDEKYYPKGVTDHDYCILKFTAETVNYYHNLSNNTFSINEFK